MNLASTSPSLCPQRFNVPAERVIEILDPPREFSLRWYEQDNPMFDHLSADGRVWGTRVTVIESGFAALPAVVRAKRLEQTALGYTGSRENLQALREGRSLPS